MEDKETVAGETTVLECMASGSPKPKLTWTKDGGPLVATERHFFTADGQLLIIMHTKPSDAGRYECEMSNSLGIERDSAILTVIPSLPGHGSGVLDDRRQIIGYVVIALVCCVVLTSFGWVLFIYQTRKRTRVNTTNTPPGSLSNTTLPPTVPFPGVDFMVADQEDPDINIDMDGMPTTLLYSPDMEILAYKGAVDSDQQLYTYLGDQHSDSEHSSKDSGTGDSGRRSNSNEDLAALADNVVGHSMHSLNTAGTSEISCSEIGGSIVSSGLPCIRTGRPRRNYSDAAYTRTLSTFVPQPKPKILLTEADSRPMDPRTRMSLYDDRRGIRHSMGSPVANYSLARQDV